MTRIGSMFAGLGGLDLAYDARALLETLVVGEE